MCSAASVTIRLSSKSRILGAATATFRLFFINVTPGAATFT